MTATKTSRNHVVNHHCHITDHGCGTKPLTPAEILFMRQTLSADHPNAVEIAPGTKEYNCHGFALAGAHGWYNLPQTFIEDDFFNVSFFSPRAGDVVVYYREDLSTPTHTAVVVSVINNRIRRVRSKWGGWGVLEHGLLDVRPHFGSPRDLKRRNPGLMPVVALTDELTMTEEETKQALIDKAIRSFSDPSAYLEVLLASTPEAAEKIIEAIPGVQELLALGPEATPAVVNFLESAETQASEERSSIALYLLQRIPTEVAVDSLANAISERRFTGISLHLAADALLNVTNVEPISEDRVAEALRVAEERKSK